VSKPLIFAALRAEFAVRIEDLGVFASTLDVQRSDVARASCPCSWAGRPCHFPLLTYYLLPLTYYLLLTSACRYSLFTLSLPPLAIFDSLSTDTTTMCGKVHQGASARVRLAFFRGLHTRQCALIRSLSMPLSTQQYLFGCWPEPAERQRSSFGDSCLWALGA